MVLTEVCLFYYDYTAILNIKIKSKVPGFVTRAVIKGVQAHSWSKLNAANGNNINKQNYILRVKEPTWSV